MKGFQLECHFHPLVQRFAKPDDTAGADTDSCLLCSPDDIFFIFHRMGGANFREIRRRRFDITMDSCDARLFQTDCLFLGNES